MEIKEKSVGWLKGLIKEIDGNEIRATISNLDTYSSGDRAGRVISLSYDGFVKKVELTSNGIRIGLVNKSEDLYDRDVDKKVKINDYIYLEEVERLVVLKRKTFEVGHLIKDGKPL